MYLKRLQLHHFRNYKRADISFLPTLNAIQGKNGQGKTNLLEAIYLISTGRSFRTHRLADLITFGEKFFYIEADFERNGVSQQITLYYDTQEKKVQCNGTLHTTLHSLLGQLPSVLSAPHDLALITGAPSERRRWIDLHLSQLDPLYLRHLSRYFKAMQQRNHLLRARTELTLTAWEQVMAESAAYIMKERMSSERALNPLLENTMHTLSSQRDHLSVLYQTYPYPPDPTLLATSLREEWLKKRSQEFLLKNTLIGPHRDDFVFQINGQSAKGFSSEGQKRCAATALRLAQWEQMHSLLGEKPLLGIDDFGVQLDPYRRSQLQEQLPLFGQVFVTAPLFTDLSSTTQLLHIEQGQVL